MSVLFGRALLLLRRLTLAFLFCVDVHVKADEVKSCLDHTLPCAISSEGKKILSGSGLRLVMDRHSLLEQRKDKTVELIRGGFYVETSEARVFQTPYVKIWCEGTCKGLFQRELVQVNLVSLEGRWLMQRKGEEQTYSLVAGLQVQVGEVSTDGRAQMEFPQSLPWTPTVNEWAALYPGPLQDLKRELLKFRPTWKEAVEAASQLHIQVAKREIASYEKDQAEQRAKQHAHEREDQSLRALFREKNP
jgi:hypothetical protein